MHKHVRVCRGRCFLQTAYTAGHFDYCCSGTRLNSTHGYHTEPSCASMLVWVARRSGLSYFWCSKMATDNCLETELPDRRPRKVWHRLDSSAEKTEVTLSAMEELKREMTEAVDMALSELNARFFWWRATVVWTRCGVDGYEYHFRTVAWLNRKSVSRHCRRSCCLAVQHQAACSGLSSKPCRITKNVLYHGSCTQ